MEIYSQAHRNLQIFCADFWDKAGDCELILSDVGVDSSRINLAEPSIMRWYSIINELRRKNDGSLGRLVIVLMKDYADNKDLQAVCAPWIPAKTLPLTAATIPEVVPEMAQEPAIPDGAVLAKKFDAEPKPIKLVPVVAPDDFADEADQVVPRLNTLWDAMVEMERRLAEMEQWRSLPKPARK